MLIEKIYDKITGGNNQGFQGICLMVQINPEYKLIRNKLIGRKSLYLFGAQQNVTENSTRHTSAVQSTFLCAVEEFLVYGKHTLHHFLKWNLFIVQIVTIFLLYTFDK